MSDGRPSTTVAMSPLSKLPQEEAARLVRHTLGALEVSRSLAAAAAEVVRWSPHDVTALAALSSCIQARVGDALAGLDAMTRQRQAAPARDQQEAATSGAPPPISLN